MRQHRPAHIYHHSTIAASLERWSKTQVFYVNVGSMMIRDSLTFALGFCSPL